jgi:hypothetical protein
MESNLTQNFRGMILKGLLKGDFKSHCFYLTIDLVITGVHRPVFQGVPTILLGLILTIRVDIFNKL